jgi:predicted ATP-binding protein involved in virulence
MCVLNPYLEDKALALTPGVVVIDELDLSLHPTWQKRMIGILKQLFPKVQFICATHSPFIIQSLEEGELITLDPPMSDMEVDYSGESIEDIAEDVMGVEMPQYSEKKRKMYEAADRYYTALKNCGSKEELENLRLEMVRLEAEYSDNPAYLALIRQEHATRAWEVEKK